MAEARKTPRFKLLRTDELSDNPQPKHGCTATYLADGMEITVAFVHRDKHPGYKGNLVGNPILDCPFCVGQDFTNGKSNPFCGALGRCARGHWVPADDSAIAWITTQALEGNLLPTKYVHPVNPSNLETFP